MECIALFQKMKKMKSRRILVLGGGGGLSDENEKNGSCSKRSYERFESQVIRALDEFEWKGNAENGGRPLAASCDVEGYSWKRTPCLMQGGVRDKVDEESYEERICRLASVAFRLLEDANQQRSVTSLDVFWIVSERTKKSTLSEILPIIAACRHAMDCISNTVIHIIMEPTCSSEDFPISWVRHLDATISRPDDDENSVKSTLHSLLKRSRVWRGLIELAPNLIVGDTKPCRVEISLPCAAEHVLSERTLRLLCRSKSDENIRLSRLRIVRCVSKSNMIACFATMTMSRRDMLRITISNQYKQRRTALARFLKSWASSSKKTTSSFPAGLLVEAVADGGRKRVKFRSKEYLLLCVHSETEFLGHVVTRTCLQMNTLSCGFNNHVEMSEEDEKNIDTETLLRLPTFDVSAALWQHKTQDEDLDSMTLQELKSIAKSRNINPEKGHKGRKKTWIDALSTNLEKKKKEEEEEELRKSNLSSSSDDEEEELEEDIPVWAQDSLKTEWKYLQRTSNKAQKRARKTSKAEQRLKDASQKRKRKQEVKTMTKKKIRTTTTTTTTQNKEKIEIKPQPSPSDLTSSAKNALSMVNAAEQRRRKRLRKNGDEHTNISWRDLAQKSVVKDDMTSRVSLNGMGVHYRHEDERSSAANSNTERSSFTMSTNSSSFAQDNMRRSREGGSYLHTVPPTPVFSPGTYFFLSLFSTNCNFSKISHFGRYAKTTSYEATQAFVCRERCDCVTSGETA